MVGSPSKLMQSIDDFSTEIIITLEAVMVGTVTAQQFQLSAPLVMVVAGLLIGNDRVKDSAK